MAPAAASAYQALVELGNESLRSPREQLGEAARIIGLDLDDHFDEQEERRDRDVVQTAPAPKEEWVLRWLLKKLKTAPATANGTTTVGSGNAPSGYAGDKCTWILFRALFGRIPPRPLAGILAENKFLNILAEVLSSLHLEIETGGGSEGAVDAGAEESSPKRGRKRKRAETGAAGSVGGNSVPSSWSHDLLLAVLQAINQLVSLVSRIPDSQAATRSQLKLALRGEPGLSGRILGHTLRCTSEALVQLATVSTLNMADVQQRLLRLAHSTVAIWEFRSNNAGSVSGNDAFASHSLPSALRLLLNLQDLPLSAAKETINHSLERLVVLHVILPLRECFFSLKTTQASGESQANPDQVRAILANMDSKLSPDTRGTLLPTLFDITMRSVPRDTFRRRINEAPWLETLFVALAARLGCSINIEYTLPLRTDEEPISLLQQLLQVAIDRKLAISLQTLAHYAMEFSGIMFDGEPTIHWRLIAQLITLDADVFLPNSGYAESRTLLDKLIFRIMAECIRNLSPDTETYTTLKAGVVVPLLRGFASARDLETFVQIWKEQITVLETERSSRDDSYCYTVWEDDDLLGAYGNIVSATFPVGHIKKQIDDLASGISVSQDPSSPSAAYPQMILLDALLMSKPREDGTFIVDRPLFDKVLAATCSLLLTSNRSLLHWRWRLWRVKQNLFDKFPLSTQQVPTRVTEDVLPMAAKNLQFLFTNAENSSVQKCREAYCSFGFLTYILTRANISKGDEYLNTLIPAIMPLLSSLGKSTRPAWDGRIETLESAQTVAIGFLTISLSCPAAVVKLTSENRRLLFTTVLSTLADAPAAQSSSSSSGKPKPDRNTLSDQLVKVWDSFVSADWLLAAAPAVYDLVSVLSKHFMEKQSSLRLLLLRSLLTIPSRLIPPPLRVSLLDDSLDEILVRREHQSSIQLGLLSLMKRLVELPRSSAQIVTDWEALWKVADSISLRGAEESSSLVQAFEQLHKAVIDRIMMSSDNYRQEYTLKTTNKISSLSENLCSSTARYESLTYFMFSLSLNWSWKELDDDSSSKVKLLSSLRENTVHTAVTDLQSLARQAKKRPAELDEVILRGALSVLDTFPDLARASKDARKATRKLDEHLSKKSQVDMHTQKLVKRQCIAQLKGSADFLPDVTSRASAFPVDHPYATDQCAFVHEIRQQVSSMSSQKRVDLVRSVREQGVVVSGGGEDAPYQLVLAGIAISSFAPIESRESPEATELSSLLTSLADSLSRFSSIEPFCLATECIDLVLRTHPKCASQWNIDNLIAAISVSASTSGPRIPPEYAETVYTRLCRLLGTLFGLYRQKLSGRFHLILPPLQRLLRCLFTRGSGATTTTSSRSSPLGWELPPWLGNMDETPLHAHHAGQFCRLLTSLCDPTVSAVQLPRAGVGLSDSTKKVKSLAGQYLQYVVMEYAGLQLRGHLFPAMKAALMPGLYSVLDVMSRPTMRAMNAGMDSSRQAMFKGLYDDYVRFGKWNHD